MKKKLVIKLFSAAMAISIAFTQGGVCYAAATAGDIQITGTEDSKATEPGASDPDAEKKDGDEPGETDPEATDSKDAEAIDPEAADPEADTEVTDPDEIEPDPDAVDPEASVPGEIAEPEVTDLPEGINPMPEDFTLSEEQKDMKEAVRDHDVLDDLSDFVEGHDYVKNEVIALADSREEAEAIAAAYSGELVEYAYGIATISLADSKLSVKEAFEYALDDELELPLVEPNYITYFEKPIARKPMRGDQAALGGAVPTGNGFLDRWWNDGYNDPYINQDEATNQGAYQWHHRMVNSYSAWGVTTGDPDIVVAVVDTGVKASHTDLDDNIDHTDLSADGFTHYTDDSFGHGTHVAGIIAGELNDQMGAGIAPGVKILPIDVTSKDPGVQPGGMDDADIARALNALVYGGTRKADIVNMSLGGPTYTAVLQEAVNNLYKSGVTVVVAMSNNRANQVSYPTCFDHVIAVCSVDESGARSTFSNYGPWADVSAPGTDIWSADFEDVNDYVSMDGTSMACPIVSGACALYMSAHGHVDPDTMERVIRSSVSGSAGAGTGTGILDLARMFGGDTTAPKITLTAADASAIAEVQDGKKYTAPYSVAGDAIISFTPMNFGGSQEGNENTAIVYTTNGSTPAVSGGQVVNGTLYDKSTPLTVSSISTATAPTKVTLRALAVTGMGVTSKVSTLIFTYDPALTGKDSRMNEFKVEILNAPANMTAGKSIKLESRVTNLTDPQAAPSQAVTWRIEGYEDGDMSKARIHATNGTLTTAAGQTGTLIVYCTTADSRYSATARIKVVSANDLPLIKDMAINEGKAAELRFDYDGEFATGQSKEISITKLTDTAGHNLLTDDTDKSFQWITSDSKVVTVEKKDGKSATITAVSAGSAAITCKAMDGSGKSARINVKVISDRRVASISIVSALDPTLTLKLLHNSVGNESEEPNRIQVKMTNTDGSTCTVAPLWTSSNTKVAVVEGSGKSVQVKPVARGTAVITAAAQDGSGKKASVKIEVFQLAKSVKVNGQRYIAEGATAQFTATVLPANTNNKKVSWELVDNPDPANITIAQNGKVTVKKGATYDVDDTVTVKATAVDGGHAEHYVTFNIRPKATKVTLSLATESDKATIATFARGAYSNTTNLKATVDNGTALSFTINNPKIATVTDNGDNTATVTAVGKGTAVITAAAQDGSGKRATFKVNVLQLVNSIAITGQSNIAVGNKAQFKATVLPANANNKGIDWYLLDENGALLGADKGVGINAKGQVTVSKDCTAGTIFKVFASPKDTGFDAWPAANCSVATCRVTDRKVGAVSVRVDDSSFNSDVNSPGYNKAGALTAIRLYDTNIPIEGSDVDERTIKLKGSNDTGAAMGWSSSNARIVTVNGTEDGSVTVTALKTGTANITCIALDGSGKKAVVKVTVIKPASGIRLVLPSNITMCSGGHDGNFAMGKSISPKVVLGNAFGKPSVGKVSWEYQFGVSVNGSYFYNYDADMAVRKSKKFGTFSSGRINAASEKNCREGLKEYVTKLVDVGTIEGPVNYAIFEPTIWVKATTTDGTGYSSASFYYFVKPAKNMFLYDKDDYNNNGGRMRPVKNWTAEPAEPDEPDENVHYEPKDFVLYFDGGDTLEFIVHSSNPKAATGFVGADRDENGNLIDYYLVVYPYGKGSTNLKITALDGTGKSCSLNVKVK